MLTVLQKILLRSFTCTSLGGHLQAMAYYPSDLGKLNLESFW